MPDDPTLIDEKRAVTLDADSEAAGLSIDEAEIEAGHAQANNPLLGDSEAEKESDQPIVPPPGSGREIAVARRPSLPPASERFEDVKWWSRRVLAAAGLLLFAGCLFCLLNGGSLPVWHLRDAVPSAVTGASVAVVIDPGHGGWDTGAVAQGVREKDLNLDVGLRVAQVLEKRGVKTKLTRDDDHFIPLSGRAWMANSLPGSIFVSIHFNDAPSAGRNGSRANGIETFYSEFKEAPMINAWTLASLLGGSNKTAPFAGKTMEPPEAILAGRELADSIQSSVINGTAATDRGIKERSLYVTRHVQGPAVLVEGGFVSHPAEARLLGDPNYRQRLAESIADGIVRYLAAPHHPGEGSPLAVVRKAGE